MEKVAPKKEISGIPEREQLAKSIVIYVCPTPECDNYYGAPSFREDRASIETMQYRRNQNDGKIEASHPRVECPECRIVRDIHVNRVPYIVTEMVPLHETVAAVQAAQ